MNDGFKQRLVGAIVLTCAGLIVWPLLFSDSTGTIVDRRSQIPPMPKFEKFEVAEPVRPEHIVPVAEPTVEEHAPVDMAPQRPIAASTSSNQGGVSSRVAKALEQKPALDDKGLPQGWVLQVASLSDASNAEALKKDLQDAGYKAYTREVSTTGGAIFRVYIGPKMTKEAFDKDRPLIDKKYKVKSIVVKFEQ